MTPRKRDNESAESFHKRTREFEKKLDDLILLLEPIHDTIYRSHYNLPLRQNMEDLTDIDILVDNRRWKYTHGELDEDGEPIVEQEEDEEENSFDWLEEEDKDESWLPDGPEFELGGKAMAELMRSGEMMTDEKTRRQLLAEAEAAELRDLLSRSEPEY